MARLLLRCAALERARDEDFALLRHLFDIFLAHRAAQQVGAAQAIAADQLRHLHNLLLVDHDAVSLAQHRLYRRMRIVEFLAMLAPHEIRYQVHRAGTV